MKGAVFIRRAQRSAKAQGLVCHVDQKRGKGSHVTRYLGDRLTIVRDHRDELKTGTLSALLKPLGLSLSDP